jgi:uncharacterized protein YbaA (DUF1428 family)
MPYVDGCVPVPIKNLQAYRRMAQKAGKVWRSMALLSTASVRAMTSMSSVGSFAQ